MSGDAQQQLQAAIYNALTTALAPIKVYDHVPQDANFPYVVIGEGDAREFDTTTELGQEHQVIIHVFSQGRGKKEAKGIQKQIYDALHYQSLSLSSGAALVHILFDLSGVTLDPDGLTYHGVSQFRAITTEA